MSDRVAPRDEALPSEAAIEAAREASAHTAELGMADVLLPRRAMIASLRAAYAIDLLLADSQAPQAAALKDASDRQARIRELEDALRPFAALAATARHPIADTVGFELLTLEHTGSDLTWGDLRRAAAACHHSHE